MILSDKKRIQDFTDKGWWGNDTLYCLFQDALAQCKDQEGLVDPENRPNITGDSPKRLTCHLFSCLVRRRNLHTSQLFHEFPDKLIF